MTEDIFDESESTPDENIVEIDLPQEDSDRFWVPNGEYDFICRGFKKDHAKESGNPMLVWEFNGGPDNKPLKMRIYTSLQKSALFKLAEVAEALGVGKAGQTLRLNPREVIGRRCRGITVTEVYEGQKRASLKRVKPHPQGPIVDHNSDSPF